MMKRLFKNEKGASLIEVLIGTLILGMIAATFVSGMNTVVTTSFRNSRQVHALALAQSQMEYIKQQEYNTDNSTNMVKYLIINSITSNYEIYGWIEGEIISDGKRTFAEFWYVPPYEEGQPPPEGEPSEIDTGLQKICVNIYHRIDDEPVVTLYGFKADHELPE